MTDIEFMEEFSEEIGKNYKKFKVIISQSPGYALVHIRILLNDIINIILVNSNYKTTLKKDLFSQIKYLFSTKLIDEECRDLMHELRQASNQGAHPDEFYMTFDDYKKSAEKSRKKICEVIKKLYFSVKKIQAPDYCYIELIESSSIEKLCYLSIIDDDPIAQYEIGKILQSKAELMSKHEMEDKNKFIYTSLDESYILYKKAFHWFDESSQKNVDSLYEYALCLMRGKGVTQNLNSGENYLRMAAYRENINAKAYYGNMLLYGTENTDKDVKEALILLKEAAEENHPSALDTLGICYFYGKGEKINLNKSLDCITKAAKMGYPNAEYNLAMIYINGKLTDKNEVLAVDFLDKASKKGHKQAKIALANMYIKGMGCEVNKDKAHELYLNFIENDLDLKNNLEESLEVEFDLAMHYYNDTFGPTHLGKSLRYLQHIYEYSEKNYKLKEKAYNKSPQVLKKLIQNINNIQEEDIEALTLFDDNGYPTNNIKESMSFLLENPMINIHKMGNLKRFKFLSDKKIGRNDKCPCNSGKKYKSCCLK